MTSQEVRDAKSRCADKFMEQHPEVAVRALNYGQWEAWSISEDSERYMQGWGRNGAIANYQRMYHSACPPAESPDLVENPDPRGGGKKPPNNYTRYADMVQAFTDSAKYRRIVEEYERYIGAPLYAYEDIQKSNFLFTAKLWKIIEDDFPTHRRRHRASRCDKCHQELK